MKLFFPIVSALGLAHAVEGTFTMTCNDDKTLSIDINHSVEAEIVSVTYGECDMEAVRVGDPADDGTITITADIADCVPERSLRELEYNQDATIVVGRTGNNGEVLVLAEYVVDAYCSFTDEYTVSYEYGAIDTASSTFDQLGGNRAISFSLLPYDSDFGDVLTEGAPMTSGETVYLKLAVHADHHEDFEYDTKTFVPTRCVISEVDTDGNAGLSYTVFDATLEGEDAICANSPIDLVISDSDTADNTQAWKISHTLFQFEAADDTDVYTMDCDIKVCDVLETTDCDAVRACLTPDAEQEASGDGDDV